MNSEGDINTRSSLFALHAVACRLIDMSSGRTSRIQGPPTILVGIYITGPLRGGPVIVYPEKAKKYRFKSFMRHFCLIKHILESYWLTFTRGFLIGWSDFRRALIGPIFHFKPVCYMRSCLFYDEIDQQA